MCMGGGGLSIAYQSVHVQKREDNACIFYQVECHCVVSLISQVQSLGVLNCRVFKCTKPYTP